MNSVSSVPNSKKQIDKTPIYIQIVSSVKTNRSVDKDEILILQVRNIVKSLLANGTTIRLPNFVANHALLGIHHWSIGDSRGLAECLSAGGMSLVEERQVDGRKPAMV